MLIWLKSNVVWSPNLWSARSGFSRQLGERVLQGRDWRQPARKPKTAEERTALWENVVKMAIITRDLMVGNPETGRAELWRRGFRTQCDCRRIPRATPLDRSSPNGDFMEAILNSSYDWTGVRPPYILATENDALNAVCMLFWQSIDRTGASVCRCANLLESRRGWTCHGFPPWKRVYPPDQPWFGCVRRHRATSRSKR